MAHSDLPGRTNWGPRWHAARTIQRRASRTALYSPGIFITMSLSLLIAAIILHNSLRYADQNFVLIARHPLFLPLFVTMVMTSLFLAMRGSLDVARERDQGTLELLLFGPVDEASFIAGSFLAQLKVYTVVTIVALGWSALVARLLNLSLSLELAIGLLTSIATASAVIAFGLLLAAWGGRTRSTLIWFILIAALVLGAQIADEIVRNLVVADGRGGQADPLFLLRQALASLAGILQWVSPYAQLLPAMEALLDHNIGAYIPRVVTTLVQAASMLAGAIWFLRRGGSRA